MKKDSPVSRDDVARLAGVSSATVSRVYNQPDKVSEAKRVRVLEACEKLGYVPNKSASSLRRGGSGHILFIEHRKELPQFWASIIDIFYAKAVRSVRNVIEDSMYLMTMHSVGESLDILSLAQRVQFDGIVYFDSDSERDVDLVEKLNVPYVMCHHTRHYGGFNRCYTNNFNGGKIQGNYLRKLGFSRPAYVVNQSDSIIPHRERMAGFLEAFGTESCMVFDENWSLVNGYESGKKLVPLIRSGKIDCIGVVNDFAALGVIRALLEEGIDIPRDVSIIGYDNSPIIYALPFRLSTVDLRMSEVYNVATSSLMKVMTGGGAIDTGIDPVVVEGDSVRRN